MSVSSKFSPLEFVRHVCFFSTIEGGVQRNLSEWQQRAQWAFDLDDVEKEEKRKKQMADLMHAVHERWSRATVLLESSFTCKCCLEWDCVESVCIQISPSHGQIFKKKKKKISVENGMWILTGGDTALCIWKLERDWWNWDDKFMCWQWCHLWFIK